MTRAEKIFGEMMSASKVTGLPLHYREDLEVDRAFLEGNFAERGEVPVDFVWVLRDKGTLLFKQGYHTAKTFEAACGHIFGDCRHFYICKGNCLRHCTRDEAREFLAEEVR